MGLFNTQNIVGSIREWFRRKEDKEDFSPSELAEWALFSGVLKSFSDPAYDLSVNAYRIIWSTDVASQPLLKLAQKIGSMKLSVVGSGKRAEELQKIIDQTVGVADGLEHLSGARVEGVRFLKNRVVWDEQIERYVGDFRGCAARKWKAGGFIYWKGWEADVEDRKQSLGKVERWTSNTDKEDQEEAKPEWLNRDLWTVFRPGAGTSPEGEWEIAYQVFLIAEAARLLDKSLKVYAERYGLPRELLKKMIDSIRPDEMTPVMQSAAAKLQLSAGRQRGAIPLKETVELIEPKGTTYAFLAEYRSMLERRVHKLILGEDISSGGQESGDRGGREMGDKQMNSTAVSWGSRIADALTSDWLPFIEKANAEFLPKLKKDEPKPYLVLRPPVEKQRITIPELKQVAEMKIPCTKAYVYEIVGDDAPEEAPDVFDWANMTPPAMPGAGGDDTLSSTGEQPQRKDREKPGSGIPAESTKPQKKEDDLRNVKKMANE